MKTQKFGEMTAGTLFNDGRRSFIKLMTKFPSGIPIDGYAIIVAGKPTINLLNTSTLFNSVDSNGAMSKCPDWLEFNLGWLDNSR
jgi:hypothetical protein